MSAELTGTALARTVGVIGVVAAIGAGAWLYSGQAVSNEINFIQQEVQELRGMVSNDNTAANATTANLVNSGKVPDGRINGTNVTSGWGNVTVAPANVTGTANDGFTWAYPAALTTRQCNDLVDGVAPFANTITVNGTEVKANAAALNTATKITQCATDPASVTFGFSKSAT